LADRDVKLTIGVPKATLHQAWDEIYDSGQFAEGKYTRLFEDSVAELYSDQVAVAFNSAGTALESMLSYYCAHGKTRWLVAGNTFYASASSVLMAGGSVWLADSNPIDFCLDAAALAQAQNIDGVVLTHVGGPLSLHYQEIAAWCREQNLLLVEDAAHAFGTVDEHGWRAGDLGNATVFSFYPTKAVPVGDAGIALTGNPELARWLQEIRNYSKKLGPGPVVHRQDVLGQNYRVSEWNAAIGYHQVKRLSEILELRQSDAYKLAQIVPPLIDRGKHSNWYKYIVPATVKAQQQTGKVYRAEDQIQNCLDGWVVAKAPLPGCRMIAQSHNCLPVGEGVYRRMSKDRIVKTLGLS
jgi:dTDP-4-amino-4,6-dideoxygalactose transaminase